METQAHTCPMFTPVGNVKDNGGTSCGNCVHFNIHHVEHYGKLMCNKYDELVFWSNGRLS